MFAVFFSHRAAFSIVSKSSTNYLLKGRHLLSPTVEPCKRNYQLLDSTRWSITPNNYKSGILNISTANAFENALKIPKMKKKPDKANKKCEGDKEEEEDSKDKKEHKGHMSHGKLWFIEKVISAALIPIIPLAIMAPNLLFDLILLTALTPHIHWGIVATVIDYVRPIIVGDLGAKIAYYACFGITAFIILGLLKLALRGQGIGNSVRTLWSMGPNQD